jgi:hypothetical protein
MRIDNESRHESQPSKHIDLLATGALHHEPAIWIVTPGDQFPCTVGENCRRPR